MIQSVGTARTAAEAARHYLRHGVLTTPVKPRAKQPWDFVRGCARKGWEQLKVAEADIDLLFPPDCNLGLLLGAPSGGIVDVDLDCPEARRAAPHLLPRTEMIGGRQSAPDSHHFFVCDQPPAKASEKYHDPFVANRSANVLLELRSTGGQTVVGPSTYGADPAKGHPEPEAFVWSRHGEPARVPVGVLRTAVRAVAVAALLGRYWPRSGRHDAALALAGGLRRAGWLEGPAVKFVTAVAAAANDEEAADRVAGVRSTFAAGKDDRLAGWPAVSKILGDRGAGLVRTVTGWLGLDPTGGNSADIADSARGWPDPMPLSSPPAVPSYPTDVLPAWLREWAGAVATELQVPVDLPAGLGLGLIGGGIGRKVVVCPRPGFTEPTNVYVMVALPPGERKTQTHKKAMAPVLELERELIAAAAPTILERESEQRIAEKRVKNLEDKLAKAEALERDELRTDLATAREELLRIEVPARPVLYTEDDSPEALKHELIRQCGRLMVATTEAKCLENITLYSDRPNFDVYLKAHAGDELRTGRIGRGRESVTDPALTCLLTPQPEVLRGLAENDVLRGRGFLARWFYQLPLSRVGSRAVGAPAVPDRLQRGYHERVKAVWQTAYGTDEAGGAEATTLVFDAAARTAFEEFERWLEPQLAPGRDLARLAGWGSKLNGACARLAAALHVADALESGGNWTGPIGAGVVRRAVQLCREYYIPHAVAAFDLMGANETLAGARRVWNWVRENRLTRFSKREALNGNRSFESVDQLQPCLDLLERHYLIRQQQQSERRGPGRPTSPVYDVNPGSGWDEGGPSCPDMPSQPPPWTDPVTPPAGPATGGSVDPDTPAHNPQNAQKCRPPAPAPNSADCAHSAPGVPGPPPGRPLVATAVGVAATAGAVAAWVGAVGLDTETTGLDPRTDRVRLIQVAVGGDVAVVDVFALPDPVADLAPLFAALAGKEVVGHNLQFDLRFLAPLGFVPGTVYDTVLASRVLHAGGRGDDRARLRHGLGDVVGRELGRAVDKGEQSSDWSGRLTPRQLAYAVADVAVLLPLAESLKEKLAAADLTATAACEMRALPGIAWAPPIAMDVPAWLAIADAAEADRCRLADAMDSAAPNPAGLPGMESWNWDSTAEVKDAFARVGVPLDITDDDTLAGVAHPLADLLRDYRGAAKRVGTYGRAWVEKHVRGDRVLPSWNQLGAESGRMSCSDPNLQQIPRGSDYRKCFVAALGRVLVKADYSQVELRIAARVANEPVMIAAYKDGRDLHTLTAARVLGKSEADVTKADRQLAKAINFGLLYGMGWKSLKRYAKSNYGVELTDAQAKSYRNAFFKAYPALRAWHARVEADVKRRCTANPDGVHEVRTLAGRRRVLPVAKRDADGKAYPNKTDALNTPVQGTGADGLKAAIALLWERRAECPGSVPVIFCHDEVVLDVPEADAGHAADWLRRCMVEAVAPLIDPVPVEVEVTTGRTWGG